MFKDEIIKKDKAPIKILMRCGMKWLVVLKDLRKYL